MIALRAAERSGREKRFCHVPIISETFGWYPEGLTTRVGLSLRVVIPSLEKRREDGVCSSSHLVLEVVSVGSQSCHGL